MLSSPTNFFITESHDVTKAASFHSKPSESSPTMFGGEWAQRTKPLIEEISDDVITETCTEKLKVKVQVTEDLEDGKNCDTTAQHPAKSHISHASKGTEKLTVSTGQAFTEE